MADPNSVNTNRYLHWNRGNGEVVSLEPAAACFLANLDTAKLGWGAPMGTAKIKLPPMAPAKTSPRGANIFCHSIRCFRGSQAPHSFHHRSMFCELAWLPQTIPKF